MLEFSSIAMETAGESSGPVAPEGSCHELGGSDRGGIFASLVTSIAVASTWDFYVPTMTDTLILGVVIVFPLSWFVGAFGISAVTKSN